MNLGNSYGYLKGKFSNKNHMQTCIFRNKKTIEHYHITLAYQGPSQTSKMKHFTKYLTAFSRSLFPQNTLRCLLQSWSFIWNFPNFETNGNKTRAITTDKTKFCAQLTHRAVGYSFSEQSSFKNIRSGKVMLCRANCRTDFFNHHSLISTSLVSSKLVFTVVVKCVEQNFPNSLKVLVQSKTTIFPLVTLNDNTRKLINHTHLH